MNLSVPVSGGRVIFLYARRFCAAELVPQTDPRVSFLHRSRDAFLKRCVTLRSRETFSLFEHRIRNSLFPAFPLLPNDPVLKTILLIRVRIFNSLSRLFLSPPSV